MESLLAKLGVNWMLLLAQIVNFAILLAILTKFLYRPFLNLLDVRSMRIRKSMEEAERAEKQAGELAAIREEALRTIDRECGVILERAKSDAETLAEEIRAHARQEAEILLRKAEQQIAEDRRAMLQEVQGQLSTLILRVTEKLLQREFQPADQARLLASLKKDMPTFPR